MSSKNNQNDPWDDSPPGGVHASPEMREKMNVVPTPALPQTINVRPAIFDPEHYPEDALPQEVRQAAMSAICTYEKQTGEVIYDGTFLHGLVCTALAPLWPRPAPVTADAHNNHEQTTHTVGSTNDAVIHNESPLARIAECNVSLSRNPITGEWTLMERQKTDDGKWCAHYFKAILRGSLDGVICEYLARKQEDSR